MQAAVDLLHLATTDAFDGASQMSKRKLAARKRLDKQVKAALKALATEQA